MESKKNENIQVYIGESRFFFLQVEGTKVFDFWSELDASVIKKVKHRCKEIDANNGQVTNVRHYKVLDKFFGVTVYEVKYLHYRLSGFWLEKEFYFFHGFADKKKDAWPLGEIEKVKNVIKILFPNGG